jgi:hypothetical protein
MTSKVIDAIRQDANMPAAASDQEVMEAYRPYFCDLPALRRGMVLTHLRDSFLYTRHVTKDYAETVQHIRELAHANEALLKAGR